MLVDRPWFKPALAAIWIVALGSLYSSLYAKYQFVAACQAKLGELQLMETQVAQTETQLDASEARLDAAEAQLDNAK